MHHWQRDAHGYTNSIHTATKDTTIPTEINTIRGTEDWSDVKPIPTIKITSPIVQHKKGQIKALFSPRVLRRALLISSIDCRNPSECVAPGSASGRSEMNSRSLQQSISRRDTFDWGLIDGSEKVKLTFPFGYEDSVSYFHKLKHVLFYLRCNRTKQCMI